MRDSSIQSILLRTFIAFSAVIVVIITLVLYGHFSRELNKIITNDSQLVVNKASQYLENYIESTTQLFYMIDHTLQKNQALSSLQLQQDIENLLFTRKDIVSITFVDTKGKFRFAYPNVESKETVKKEDWFTEAIDKNSFMQISQPHVLNLYNEQFPWVVSFSKLITIKRNNEMIEGVLVLHVNFNQIENILQQITKGTRGYIYIIEDSGGNMVYHPRLELVYARLMKENVELALKHSYGTYTYKSNTYEENRQNKIMSIQTISNVGWKVVGVVDVEGILLGNIALKGPLISLGIAFLLIVFVISSVISRWISNPIRRLERKMKEISNSELGVRVEITPQANEPREIQQLSIRFMNMMNTISELMQRIVREENLKRKHELNALQAQINPHFLYNTLDMVVSMVGVNKNDEVIKTITALSRLFRISIGKGKQEITIREELEHVRNYLLIQQYRYKDKFEFIIEMDKEVSELLTLKLIIQPLVENAIKHGFELAVDKGILHVSAKLVDGQVVFTIEDNGLGMSDERLKQIELGKYVSNNGTGVGITNVQSRIHLYYGKQYNLKFESELEEGTKVTVTLPVIDNTNQA